MAKEKLTKEQRQEQRQQKKLDRIQRRRKMYEIKTQRQIEKYDQKIQKAEEYKRRKEDTNYDPILVSHGLWKYLKKHRNTMLILIIAGFFAALAQTVTLWGFGFIFDKFFVGKNIVNNWQSMLGVFIGVIVAMFFMYLINFGFNLFTNLMMAKISEKSVCFNVRNDLFAKLQRLSIRYFDTHASGDIVTRASNDIDNISWALTQYIIQDFYNAFLAVLTTILMLMINWALGLITLIVYPIMVISFMKISNWTAPYFERQTQGVGKLNAFTEERVSGIKIISLYQKEKLNADEFANINKELTQDSIIANATMNILNPLNTFFNNLAFIVLGALGLSLCCTGAISPKYGVPGLRYESVVALGIAFTTIARNLTQPIGQIVNSLSQIQLGAVSVKRMFQILDEKDEEKDLPTAKPIEKMEGYVEAKDLTFGYDPEDRMILKNVSFKAVPNQVTALVGPTGSGKTTIVNLISKFYDINGGDLLIDNKSVKDITRESLRDNITIVLQDTFLFDKTVRENIRYGRLDATDEEVEQAAKSAYADNFIRALPQGYDTVLQDNAANLSAGQKQMLAIARAFLADAKIVILDEASSSIDTRTELDLQKAFKALMKNRTSFMIAHRLSTIRDADMILVIKDGQIEERGKHTELMQKQGLYYELYNAQFGGKEI